MKLLTAWVDDGVIGGAKFQCVCGWKGEKETLSDKDIIKCPCGLEWQFLQIIKMLFIPHNKEMKQCTEPTEPINAHIATTH